MEELSRVGDCPAPRQIDRHTERQKCIYQHRKMYKQTDSIKKPIINDALPTRMTTVNHWENW